MENQQLPLDGNEATARIAYKVSDIFAIYPITPSSPMGELVDQLSSNKETNIFGNKPKVVEMQSEAGVAGALHGALQTGSLASSFTCSQGLLLMIPNLYKIAGEMSPCVIHVAARSLAAQALSIFGDHQDVMAVRQTGFAMICSASVQEAQDTALIAHAATLEAKIPFIHFFDGFRTSHEINKINLISDTIIKELIDERFIAEHRERALNPEKPFIRGTAQNPDVYFQGRETTNKYYSNLDKILEKYFNKFAEATGRKYDLFEYFGHPEAEKIIVIMGSGTQTVKETIESLPNKKLGVIQVKLYRPFLVKHFIKVLPKTVQKIAVLDRTKECGSIGEPLYLDVLGALHENKIENISVVGGRYGLSSKEFTPAMVKAIFDNLEAQEPKNHFTVGIIDDVTNNSLVYDENFIINKDNIREAIFFGLGSDGTVGANKNSVKIICNQAGNYGQAYFVYDSKKSGSITESHLRFGKKPINSPYLIQQADFIACHQFSFLFKIDILKRIKTGGTFLLNTHYSKEEVWNHLPRVVQETIINKKLHFYIIDAYEVADQTNMGSKINTIMQTCFFKLTEIIDTDKAIQEIKNSIVKTYSKKGQDIIDNNIQAVDKALDYLYKVEYTDQITSKLQLEHKIPKDAPEFVKNVTAKLISHNGEEIKVSEMPIDGTFPSDTSKYEKRNIAEKIAVWDQNKCIQCGRCILSCPHSCLEAKFYSKEELTNMPPCFKVVKLMGDRTDSNMYTIQISPEDCTGCSICAIACPVQAIHMEIKEKVIAEDLINKKFFDKIKPEEVHDVSNIKNIQFKESLFKYSGACAGCGETPYLSLLTKLFGDRMIVANATGCSSIYGGNLPTTPWSKNSCGQGPAWSNSLFEDNAEFGLGMQISLEDQRTQTLNLLTSLTEDLDSTLVKNLIDGLTKINDVDIKEQRARLAILKEKLKQLNKKEAKRLYYLADNLLPKSVWIIGGDGWAYDIGYGGLDHVLASGKNVNILVMDTEVYSNTGGQASKATPLGAVAKFATEGKRTFKKDLGWMAMTYNNVYVAQIAIRANPQQALQALKEAGEYNGPSIIIAYGSCLSHGIKLENSFEQQKKAVESGMWLLYRYNPGLVEKGKNPLQLDCKEPNIQKLEDFLSRENRFLLVKKNNPDFYEKILEDLKKSTLCKWQKYKLISENFLS